MAGTIIADYIRSDANKISLNVGNTVIASVNAMGILSNTGAVLINSSGTFSANNISSGRIPSTSVMPLGSVLQVVQAQKTDTFSTSSTTFVDVTGLSVSITPSSTTSKILVFMNVMLGVTQHSDIKIVRNTTDIAIGDAAGNRTKGTGHIYRGYTGGIYDVASESMVWLDSPSTTSATTYKIQIGNPWSGTYATYVNRTANDSDNAYDGRNVSTITVMEIAA